MKKSKAIGNLVLTNKGEKAMKKIFSVILTLAMVFAIGIVPVSAAYGYGSSYGSYGYNYNCDSYVYSGTRNSYSSITAANNPQVPATRLEIVKHYQALVNSNYNSYNDYNNYNYGYNVLQQFADYNELVNGYTQEELNIMAQAVQSGLLRGIEENGRNYAAPAYSVTRAQYAAFTNRAIQISGVSFYGGNYRGYNFSDIDYTHWAYNDVQSVVSKGIMSGYNEYTFDPNGNIKSQDALLTYYRIFVEESNRYDASRFATVINNVGYFWLENNQNSSGTYFELNELGTMNVGESYKVRVATDIPAFTSSKANWSSSNTRVATVDRYGTVTAVSAGTVRITATCSGLSDTITVTVIGNNGGSNIGPNVEGWYFTRTTIPLNMNDRFNLRSVMSGWNNTITFSSNNPSVATVSSSGVVTPVGIGTAVITARDSYGTSDSITIVVSEVGSDRPIETPSPELYFSQNSITIQRGNSVDLAGYLENANGSVTYTGGNSYVSVSGSTATGIAVGTATITASCNGQTAMVLVQVVDNNVSTNLNISVEFADNNTAGNLNFIVRGIDRTCEVRVNDNSDYSLVEQYRDATWGKYAVRGLYPEGGTDTIVVCVYQNGTKVYESEPYVFYTGD